MKLQKHFPNIKIENEKLGESGVRRPQRYTPTKSLLQTTRSPENHPPQHYSHIKEDFIHQMNPSQPHRSPNFKRWTLLNYWTNGENSWTIIIIHSKFGKKKRKWNWQICRFCQEVEKVVKKKKNQMTVVPVLSGVLGAVSKSIEIRVGELEKKIFGTIQAIALRKTGRILRRVLELDLLSVYLPWKPLGTTKRNPRQKSQARKTITYAVLEQENVII